MYNRHGSIVGASEIDVVAIIFKFVGAAAVGPDIPPGRHIAAGSE